MQEKVREYIKKEHMLVSGDRIMIAVSGGADSVCLLSLLCRFQERLGLAALSAVHVHHGLRGEEADRDADFVRSLCESLHIPLTIRRYDVASYARTHGYSVEEAGRILRYEAFAEAADLSNANRIAVAHHRDDSVETLFHHLLRGSGLRGLAGIPPVRDKIIRPLLCAGRNEIEAYLQENGMTYCLDSTNDSDDYTRNKIRRRMIPLAREINDRAVENILQAGRFMGQADEYLEAQAAKLCKQWVVYDAAQPVRSARIPAAVLSGEPEIIGTYVIRRMVRFCAESMRDITAEHIFQVRSLLLKETGAHTDLPGGLAAEREYDTIRVFAGAGAGGYRDLNLPILRFRRILAADRQEIPKNQYTKWFDYDKIKGTLSARTRVTGDYITIQAGKHKSVKSYFVDQKVARRRRDEILLLAEENHVVWIVGYRISEYYKITKETKVILEVTAEGGETDEQSLSGPEFTLR